jgi:hypothetical protein
MKRVFPALIVLAISTASLSAQSLEDLNIQIHGYATQGFLYTTQNNIFTTTSSDGSPAWTEAVVSVGAQPVPKLRFAVQARYFLLGNYGNAITVDYAMADYKATDRFGVRFGKVKTPIGLFNEIQDIDPSYLWALLPQSIYPITSRNSILSHYGGVVYGTLKLGPKLGKLEYRGFGGEGIYANDDGYFIDQAEAGFNLPEGIKGTLLGGALHWRTPLPGLMVGASVLKDNRWSAKYTGGNGNITGTQTLAPNSQPNYFAIYEKDKLMVAYEYSRNWGNALTQFPGIPNSFLRNDDRGWYAMASYRLTSKLAAGAYRSYNSDHQDDLDTGRYSHDWVISGRYDFNEYFYAKAEQHFIGGTGLGYDDDFNPDLQPNTKLTVLKVGVSF